MISARDFARNKSNYSSFLIDREVFLRCVQTTRNKKQNKRRARRRQSSRHYQSNGECYIIVSKVIMCFVAAKFDARLRCTASLYRVLENRDHEVNTRKQRRSEDYEHEKVLSHEVVTLFYFFIIIFFRLRFLHLQAFSISTKRERIFTRHEIARAGQKPLTSAGKYFFEWNWPFPAVLLVSINVMIKQNRRLQKNVHKNSKPTVISKKNV